MMLTRKKGVSSEALFVRHNLKWMQQIANDVLIIEPVFTAKVDYVSFCVPMMMLGWLGFPLAFAVRLPWIW